MAKKPRKATREAALLEALVGPERLAQARRVGEVVELHDTKGRPWARIAQQTALARYAQRGQVSPDQREAGERLCRTWYFAGLSAKVMARWGESPVDRSLVGERSITERQAAARQAVRRALRAVGPILSSVLINVVIYDTPVREWIRQRDKPEADGGPVLRLALDALVAHYGGYGQRAA